MSTMRRFFETFDLAFGRLIALALGAVGGFLVYFSWHVWGDTTTLITFAVGVGLLLISSLMIYHRVTFFGVLDCFAVGSWWN